MFEDLNIDEEDDGGETEAADGSGAPGVYLDEGDMDL
jgi:hypothetical protein